MHESDNEQSKREFYYHESNNNKKNNIENDDSMLRYTYVRYMLFKKPYKKNLLLTSTAWSLREISDLNSCDDCTLG